MDSAIESVTMVASRRNRGIVLFAALLVMVILIIVGGIAFTLAISEARGARYQRDYMQILQIAQGGFERALYDLKSDLILDGTLGSWTDGTINGFACGPNVEEFYPIPYTAPHLGTGTYRVTIKNVPDRKDHIWVRTTAYVGTQAMGIESYVKAVDLSPWKNAIFAGYGSGKTVIRGNSEIAGSVLILGDTLKPDDFALYLGGGASVVNTYRRMPAVLRSKVPPLPQREFNGEVVGTLETAVRIRRGKLALDGNSSVGTPDVAGNQVKETVDTLVAPDGVEGNRGPENVFSDNGISAIDGSGEGMTFPRLTDPYKGYKTYMEYVKDHAFVIADQDRLSQLESLTPDAHFSYTDPDGRGSISMDGEGNLHITGAVYVEGALTTEPGGGSRRTITYTGTGTILAEGNVTIATSLLTPGERSFPQNILGIMTPGSISFERSQVAALGVFYGQRSIAVTKQTAVAGSLVSNYVDMGSQVPSVYHVPAVSRNMPPYMIAAQVWGTKSVMWKVHRESAAEDQPLP